ncbi:MAG: DUF1697 domain-containing protein [Gemmatimonadaceae bacterium]
MMRYVALLRGINSGRNPVTKMADLKAAFKRAGFQNVTTVIASGNVIFDAARTTEKALVKKLEPILSNALKFNVSVVVMTLTDLEHLVETQPFKGMTLGAHDRPHVTFLKKAPEAAAVHAVAKGAKGCVITAVVDRAVCTVVDFSATTPDLMRVLDKSLGKDVTTRSWKTVERVVKAAKA